MRDFSVCSICCYSFENMGFSLFTFVCTRTEHRTCTCFLSESLLGALGGFLGASFLIGTSGYLGSADIQHTDTRLLGRMHEEEASWQGGNKTEGMGAQGRKADTNISIAMHSSFRGGKIRGMAKNGFHCASNTKSNPIIHLFNPAFSFVLGPSRFSSHPQSSPLPRSWIETVVPSPSPTPSYAYQLV